MKFQIAGSDHDYCLILDSDTKGQINRSYLKSVTIYIMVICI